MHGFSRSHCGQVDPDPDSRSKSSMSGRTIAVGRPPALMAVLAAAILAVFVLDLFVPLGVAVPMLYAGVVLLAARSPVRADITLCAAIATLLIVAEPLLSQAAAAPAWVTASNRALAIVVLWTTAYLLRERKAIEASLESRVAERTADLLGANARLEQEIAEHCRTDAARQAGEKFRADVLDALNDAVIVMGTDGHIRSVNRATERLFGYGASDLAGQNIKILMPEPVRSAHDGYIANYLHTGKGKIIGVGPREVVGLRKDGTTVPLDLSSSEITAGGERLFIGVLRDISRRKETERLLQQAQKMEAVGQLTGGIAHDFNNLLTVILGNADLVRPKLAEGSDAARGCDAVLRAAERGAELTRRLLAFSRRQMLNPAATDINALVDGMTELLRRTLGEHVEISLVPQPDLWPALIDGHQLENALLNLAVNARDAMPAGGKLTIETANAYLDEDYARRHAEVTPGDYVMLAVSDSGAGMAPGTIEHAFEPFFTTKEAGKGTGLGLSMVYGFVKQSGGHIKIYSELGHGTTVKLYLPRAAGVSAAAEPTAAAAGPRGGNETVLVVEDDADVRAFIVGVLRRFGYAVIEAADGPSAVSAAESAGALDLILSDVVLPGGMNGRDVAAAVQRRWPLAAVLYASGYTQNAIMHQGRLDPGVALISKPFTAPALARRVREILDRRRV